MIEYQYNVSVLPKNNLRVVHVPMPEKDSVLLRMVGKVGRRAETESEVGSAHFLEHLFFDGTIKRPTSKALDGFIDYYGAVKNGGTGQETVEYFVRILPEYAEQGLDYLSDILLNSQFREADISKERRVISQEAASKRSSGLDILHRRRLRNCYPNQALGRTIFDEDLVLETMDRAKLLAYMSRNYNASNFVLGITGNISQEQALSLAERYFDEFPAGVELSFDPAVVDGSQKVEFYQFQASQASLDISFRGFEHYSTESREAAMLAGVLRSRLSEKIREQLHLVYSINASHGVFCGTGLFSIYTQLQEVDSQQALDAIFEELKRVADDGPDDDELQSVKNGVLANTRFASESIDSGDYYVDSTLFLNQVPSRLATIERILSFTRQDIIDIARTILTDKPKITVVAANTLDIRVPTL